VGSLFDNWLGVMVLEKKMFWGFLFGKIQKDKLGARKRGKKLAPRRPFSSLLINAPQSTSKVSYRLTHRIKSRNATKARRKKGMVRNLGGRGGKNAQKKIEIEVWGKNATTGAGPESPILLGKKNPGGGAPPEPNRSR